MHSHPPLWSEHVWTLLMHDYFVNTSVYSIHARLLHGYKSLCMHNYSAEMSDCARISTPRMSVSVCVHPLHEDEYLCMPCPLCGDKCVCTHDYSVETSVSACTSTVWSGVSVCACPLCGVECLYVHVHCAQWSVCVCMSTVRSGVSVYA